MKKAKIISKHSIKVIDYDMELSRINSVYQDSLLEEGVGDNVINPILKKKESDRTIEELMLIIKRKNIEDQKKEELNLLSEYKDFDKEEQPSNLGEFDSAVPYYVEIDGVVIRKWEVVCDDSVKIASKISKLKTELESTDYKVIKCYEASLTSGEMPYDIEQLVSDRQEMRNEINQLEGLLKEDK